MSSINHLLFSDPHTFPGDNLDRFSALGNMIVAEKPDVVICTGDFMDLDSCSEHPPKPSSIPEGPTLQEDRDAVVVAQEALWAPLLEYNEKASQNHRKQYWPRTLFIWGNHEYRLQRVALAGTTRYTLGSLIMPEEKFFRLDSFWQEVVKVYPGGKVVDGIYYTHVPFLKNGRPVSGVSRGKTICQGAIHPTIYGHTHSMDFTTHPRFDPEVEGGCDVMMSLNLPAFMEEGTVKDYAKNNLTGWTYGVCRVRPSKGKFTYDWLSTDEVKEKYLC